MAMKKENVQVYPTKTRLVPSFKLCKVIVNLSKEQYGRMVVDGKSRKILEKKSTKNSAMLSLSTKSVLLMTVTIRIR